MGTTAQQTTRMMPARRAHRGSAAVGLPVRPRFVSEIVVAPWSNGIVADGSGRLIVLEGNATEALIPDLIRLMDGTRTVKEIYSALDEVPEEDIEAAISVLVHSGLVADCGDMGYDAMEVNQDSLSFLERFVGAAVDARNGLEAYSRLQLSNIVLVSAVQSRQEIDSLAKLLAQTGAGSVTCLAARSSSELGLNIAKLPDNALVVVLSLVPEDAQLGRLVDSCCKQLRLPWLRAGLTENGASFDIGPYFDGKRSACYSCFLAAHSHCSSEDPTPPRRMMMLESEFWLSLVASEIVLHRTRIGDCLTATRFRRYSLGADSSKALTVFRTPGCKTCLPISGSITGETEHQCVPTALVYEDYVGVQQRAAGNATKEIQPEQMAIFREGARQIKELPYSKHIQLSRGLPNLEHSLLDLLRGEYPEADCPLGGEELGQILMLSLGIRRIGRNGMIKRWGATGGNLGSVEAFIAVQHVSGLQQGLYFYQARDHSLARLDNHSTSIADFIATTTGIVSYKPDAVIILVGAYHRLAQKYGPFAYKLANFDAGVAASQIGLVGVGLGISVKQHNAWDDQVIEKCLKLEPFQEQVTSVLVIDSRHSQDQSYRQDTSAFFGCDNATSGSPNRFCGNSLEAVTKTLYRESRLQRMLGTETGGRSKSVPRNYTDIPVVASFPDVVKGGRTLGEILSHRASIRHYTDHPVSLTQLASMLASAHDGDRRDWLDESRDYPLQFLVLASRVDGVAPGVYIYDYSENALRLWRTEYIPQRQGELFLQEEFAYAPLTILVFGALAAAYEKRGGFGHRQLLLRAGAAVHRCWMAALSLGMQGCPVAGIVSGAARELLGLDGYKEASLMAFTAGHTSFEQLRQPRVAGHVMP